MRSVPRPRRYVSHGALSLCRPALAFDYHREAYVLRGVGGRYGPVWREDRRRAREGIYSGPERRAVANGHPSGPGAAAVGG